MNDHQDATSKYTAFITDFIPLFGRALLISAVDFADSNWITEHYVLPPGDESPKSASIRTSFDPRFTPKEIIPSPDEELDHGLESARGLLTTIIFNRDRALCRELIPLSKFNRPPLSSKGIALLHLTGEFSKGLEYVRDGTRCDALNKFLTEILALKPFKTE